MPATIQTTPLQLHVKLGTKDARKLIKLSKAAKLTISDVIRSMIRTAGKITSPVAKRTRRSVR